MKKIGWIILLFPMFAKGQENDGIRFLQLNSWNEVLAKAKAEHKYIFVDVFATWCGPCKLMDTKIYPEPAVGELYNKNFIAIKVQMDQTQEDNEYVKNWYIDGITLKTKYNVTAFPSYLFFSPQGELVHRQAGVLSVEEFIRLGKDALDPTIQSNSRIVQFLTNWRHGIKDYHAVPDLLRLLQLTGDRSLIPLKDSMISEYVSYLNKVPENELLTIENILFLASNSKFITSSDMIFSIAKDHPEKIDGVFKNSQKTATQLVDDIVVREEIHDKIFTNKNGLKTDRPQWRQYQKNIATKYPFMDARKKILEQQKDYYRKVNNWPLYVKSRDEYFRKYAHIFQRSDSFWKYNSAAWDVFQHSSDSKLLKRALVWSDLGIKLDSTNLQIPDTKANLLYKLGRVKEAITVEEDTYTRFLKASNEAKETTGKPLEDPYFAVTLEKMKKGERTWPVINNTSK